MFKFLSIWFSSDSKPVKNKPVAPVRRHIKDVKSGEWIYIEWYKIKDSIGQLKCLNNDPETKKILLETNWNNCEPKHERVIFNYNAVELKNFNLLNSINQSTSEQSEDFDIATLQKKMNEAIEKEEYEKAEQLQKKIDNLLQKPK